MEKLKEYLKIAKANGWTLDIVSLSTEYNVTAEEVRLAVDEIYNNPYKRV